MSSLFLTFAHNCSAAIWLVLALILLRPLIKRAPRWISVALWGLVALRLVCPALPESNLSLLPPTRLFSPTIMTGAEPDMQSGMVVIKDILEPDIDYSKIPPEELYSNLELLEEAYLSDPGNHPLHYQAQLIISYAAVCSLALASVFGIYALVSWLILKRRIRTAVLLRDNIYQSERVRTPFVLGLIRPKIYLPFGLAQEDLAYILAHEQAHIRRRDPWWKLIGFVLMALSFPCNPLLCIAYFLFCRDIEAACDEKVIRELEPERRADYAQALLRCSAGKPRLGACPVAFGEVGVKKRIKTVLKYKKPALWTKILSGILCAALIVCFLTNPVGISYAAQPQQNVYTAGDTVAQCGAHLSYEFYYGPWKYSEVSIGAEGLYITTDQYGLESFPYLQIEQITRDELIHRLRLPNPNVKSQDDWDRYFRSKFDDSFDPEKAVPQCEQVTICNYRKEEASPLPDHIMYFFDGEPGWISDGKQTEIFVLQRVEAYPIRPTVLYIHDGGSFSVDAYAAHIANPHFQSRYTYGPIENYRQAGQAGIQAVTDRFQEQVSLSLRGCIVYYDSQNDIWHVQLHWTSPLVTFGGGYSVLLKSDGTVLAIWGEK